MAYTSQFQIYSSADAGAPTLTGTTGSLIAIFDACLVNGYGSKAGAGWTKPIANSGSTVYATSGVVVGSYKQGTGSMMTMYIYDSGGGAGGAREGRISGWETLTTMSVTNGVGIGSGQFPLPSQCNTYGYVTIRKSTSLDATARSWIMFADSSSAYFFAQTGDAAYCYHSFFFGDVFSLKGNTDLYRCMIKGRVGENGSAGVVGLTHGYSQYDTFNGLVFYDTNYSNGQIVTSPLNYAQAGTFLTRTWGGGGTSVAASMTFDIGKSPGGACYYSNKSSNFAGILSAPNGPDNSIYLDPILIGEPNGPHIRGRFRGLYHCAHVTNAFADGQTFYGSGDYAGKQFMCIKYIGSDYYVYNAASSLAMYVIEISNTLETN